MANQAKIVGDAVMYSDELTARGAETARNLRLTLAQVAAGRLRGSNDADLIVSALLGLSMQLDRITECVELLCVQGANDAAG